MSGAPACFFLGLFCSTVMRGCHRSAPAGVCQHTRRKQDTCIIIPPTHLTTKTAAATHLPLCTNCTGAEARGEDYPFFASRLPLTRFLADNMAFNLKEREQRASIGMGGSIEQQPRWPHGPSLPFKGAPVQPPEPARIESRSEEKGCAAEPDMIN